MATIEPWRGQTNSLLSASLSPPAPLPATQGTAPPPPSPTTPDPKPARANTTDRVNNGRVTLRINGHLHHIGLGRPLDGTRVILLINHLDVRVIHATSGEIIRTLTINPQHRYHGTGKPIGGPPRPHGPHKTKKPEP